MFAASGRRQPLPSANEEPVIDMRETDKILSEIAGMLGRWSLFKRFLLESMNVGGWAGLSSFPLSTLTGFSGARGSRK